MALILAGMTLWPPVSLLRCISMVFPLYLNALKNFCLRIVLEFDYVEFSQELVEDLGIYIVSFDRPGYGESDPNPKRTVKSTSLDIEELADQLALGSKFYVIGGSMGGEIVWSCLKYIPHRYNI